MNTEQVHQLLYEALEIGLIGFARALRRWSHRQAGPEAGSGVSRRADRPRMPRDLSPH